MTAETRAYNLTYIPDTVLLESEWVLRFAYGFVLRAVGDALTKLLGLPKVHCSNPIVVAQAIEWHRRGLDFADALHLAHSQRCRAFYSFDKRLTRRAKGLCKCTVVEP